MMRAIFLDRDGVICRNRPDHVKSWNEFAFLVHARDALAHLAMLDMPIIVITNQSAVNRGILSAESLDEIHQRMIKEIEATGGRIDRVYYCPHRPEERCSCRKPRTGLLKRAAADLEIELPGSYLVGDSWTDVQAGLMVGCTPFLILTGRGLRQTLQALNGGTSRFGIVRDLPEAVAAILDAEDNSRFERAWHQTDESAWKPEVVPSFTTGLTFAVEQRAIGAFRLNKRFDRITDT